LKRRGTLNRWRWGRSEERKKFKTKQVGDVPGDEPCNLEGVNFLNLNLEFLRRRVYFY